MEDWAHLHIIFKSHASYNGWRVISFWREKGIYLQIGSLSKLYDLHIHQMFCFGGLVWKSIQKVSHPVMLFEMIRQMSCKNPPIKLSNDTQTEFPLFFGGFHAFLQDWLGVVLSQSSLMKLCEARENVYLPGQNLLNLSKLNDCNKNNIFYFNKNTWWWMETAWWWMETYSPSIFNHQNHRIQVLAFLLLACLARCWDGNWKSAHRSCSALTNKQHGVSWETFGNQQQNQLFLYLSSFFQESSNKTPKQWTK